MVSIIIPTYNREKSILQSVKSVLSQTYQDIELIVVDDGSTDHTKEILQSIRDERFRYVYQSNAGACAARNKGIDMARGEYIAFHDSDDIWHPNKLEKQMAVFDSTKVDLVFCKLVQYQHGQIIAQMPSNIPEGIVDPIITLIGIGTQTLVAKKEVFLENRFDDKMPRLQDLEFLIRLAENGVHIYCLDEGLVDYYVGDDSISVNSEKLSKGCERILEKHPSLLVKYPEMAKAISALVEYEATRSFNLHKNNYRQYLIQAYKYYKTRRVLFKLMLSYVNLFGLIANTFYK